MTVLKKVITIAMLSAVLCMVGKSKPVFADEMVVSNVLDLDSITSSSNVTVSDVMTYEEMASVMANGQNITLTEAREILGDDISVKENNKVSSISATPQSIGYRTVGVEFQPGGYYYPSLMFYCRTEEGGSLGWGIVSVMNAMLFTTDKNGVSKGFQGSTYYNLESITSIYYMINGQFFNNSTTTRTEGGGFELGVGEGTSVNYSASIATQTSFYCGISQYGRFTQYPW